MNKTAVTLLSLGFTLTLAGCKPVPQSTTNSDTEANRSSAHSDEQYNQGYQTESRRHHHRHRDRDRSESESNADSDGSIYDRPETQEDNTSAATGNAQVAAGSRATRHHNRRARTSAPGQFDFYVLNLSWSPEFCATHSSAAECAQHRAFTLHGLWPENNDGTYPEDCSDAPGPANPSQYADIYPDSSLLEHEWQTHGTCSGLAADAFFTTARRADQSIHIPAQIANLKQQITLTPNAIVTLFTQSNPGLAAADVALTCGNNYLTAVEVCVDKTLKPQACTALKSCGATQVRIPAPQ